MCHRILRYTLNKKCNHRTFTGDTMIDCMDPTCGNSRAHPSDCLNCRHNRWYGCVLSIPLSAFLSIQELMFLRYTPPTSVPLSPTVGLCLTRSLCKPRQQAGKDHNSGTRPEMRELSAMTDA